ncbi:IclR family transcriptional regulator [Subtercola boreus]|uniref:IclR family transcriptional regulator n=1 Tax=Subtercola boreus TaxID=120213 RepID=A0A3E0VBS4_9MICO|nr:IclR family transcriptional regulator C-terminal domain-containing protein [Subtercola boreus]RFA07095.1 IclR family transcriptional regulator [Subtercola boreus]
MPGQSDTRTDRPDSIASVRSFARGLSVICAFDADHAELSVSDVGRRTGLPRAAARRFLYTLLELGYVRSNGRLFTLTPRVLELGFSYLSALSLPEIVQPHLERLSRAVGQSVSAAVIDATDIVYVSRVATERIMSVRITIGTRFPAFATSTGRVLLAGMTELDATAAVEASTLTPFTDRTITDPTALHAALTQIRNQGWAFVDEELEPGLRSLAAPVRGRNGSVLAAINISMSTTNTTGGTTEEMLQKYLPPLLQTASNAEKELRLI